MIDIVKLRALTERLQEVYDSGRTHPGGTYVGNDGLQHSYGGERLKIAFNRDGIDAIAMIEVLLEENKELRYTPNPAAVTDDLTEKMITEHRQVGLLQEAERKAALGIAREALKGELKAQKRAGDLAKAAGMVLKYLEDVGFYVTCTTTSEAVATLGALVKEHKREEDDISTDRRPGG